MPRERSHVRFRRWREGLRDERRGHHPPQEPVRGDTAIQISAEVAHDEERHRAAIQLPSSQEGRPIPRHRMVQRVFPGTMRPVCARTHTVSILPRDTCHNPRAPSRPSRWKRLSFGLLCASWATTQAIGRVASGRGAQVPSPVSGGRPARRRAAQNRLAPGIARSHPGTGQVPATGSAVGDRRTPPEAVCRRASQPSGW